MSQARDARWRTREVTTWSEFNSWFEEVFERMGLRNLEYLYRGQPDSKWPLRPSLLRHFGLDGSPTMMIDAERTTIRRFRSKAHEYLGPNVFASATNCLDWWMLMQHHGAPTRLLDWTRSPLVAAYFAVNGAWRSDGAIWVVSVRALNDAMRALYADYADPTSSPDEDGAFMVADARPELHFLQSDLQTGNMVAQQGAFSVCKAVQRDHSDIIAEALAVDVNPVTRECVVIPQASKLMILGFLERANITGSALFPGLDGVGRSQGEYVRLAAQSYEP